MYHPHFLNESTKSRDSIEFYICVSLGIHTTAIFGISKKPPGSLRGLISCSLVVGLKITTGRDSPASRNIFLMATLYFCCDIIGKSSSKGRCLYFARISFAIEFNGTRTVTGRPSFVLRGIYLIPSLITLDFVNLYKSPTRQPIKH